MHGKTQYFEGIHYVRGLAALLVPMVHARHYFYSSDVLWVAFGTYAVEIFLVISGFVLAHAMAGMPQDGLRRARALTFLRQRLLRLVPFYWAMLLIKSGPWLQEWVSQADSLRSLYWGIDDRLRALALDLLFIPHTHPLRPEHVWPLVVPGWTLNLEMMLYCVLALCLLLSPRPHHLAVVLLLTLYALGAILAPTQTQLAFWLQPRILCFPLGIATYHLFAASGWGPLPAGRWVVLITAATVGAWALGVRAEGKESTVMAFAATLIIFLAARMPPGLQSRVLKQLGDASYAIYLSHIVLAFPLLRRGLARLTDPDQLAAARAASALTFGHTWFLIALHVCAAVIVGVICHRVLEAPLTRFARRLFGASGPRAHGLEARASILSGRAR